MKRFLCIFLSVILVMSIFGIPVYADTGSSCTSVNRSLMKNEDFYNGYTFSNLFADKNNTASDSLFMFGSLDLRACKTIEAADDGTYIGKQIVTKELLYLPFGSAVAFDFTDLYDASGNKIVWLDMRMYEYDKNRNYIGEVDKEYLSPENNADDDASCKSFIVTKKEGMYVHLRFLPWKSVFDKSTVSDFEKRLNVYDLVSVNAPIFDNSTITKCWENEDGDEAWATKTIFYNKTDDMYYWFYASQSTHVAYDGCIRVRTSKNLENWSDSRVVYDTEAEGFYFTMDGALQTENGDILISLMVRDADNSVHTEFLRSKDNGNTWQRQEFILDNENVTRRYRIQRARILDDGRIFSSYFDCAKKEKAGICYSEDNGNTWKSSDFSSKASLSDNGEYDFVILNNGFILCIQRQNVDGIGISAVISTDNGRSFINETSLHCADKNLQMLNAPFIVYDEKTDNLVIYEVDRFKSGALVGIYTTGDKISDYLINGGDFSGFFVNSCYFGVNGNADEGYPHIVKTKNGSYKCFYYYPANDGKNKAGFYCVSSLDYEKYSHTPVWKNDNNFQVNVCEKCNEALIKLPFTDLTGFEYYNDFVAYTSHYNHFIAGTNPLQFTEFSPTAPITRAMFVTILYRMAGSPYADNNPYEASPFTDIKDTSVYYYDAACWALDEGITTEKTFKPYDNVNREQVASFLFRYADKNDALGGDGYLDINLAEEYSDCKDISNWAEAAMQWANYNGMITGTQQGTVNPKGATQRIHAAKILYGFGDTCGIGNFE